MFLNEISRAYRHASIQYTANSREPVPAPSEAFLSRKEVLFAQSTISGWPGYQRGPLHALAGLASAVGLGAIHYKDEAGRFGLGSFKALGGAYAVYRVLIDDLAKTHRIVDIGPDDIRDGKYGTETSRITVASATDGNHGRSVAWGAKLFGCNCTIYIHAGVSDGRERALRDLGADVVRVSGDYDETVRRCAEDARRNEWTVVSDTSWEGYRRIPTNVMYGYTVMVEEMVEQLGEEAPTHVFVQGGVGGIAATIADLFAQKWGARRPRFVVVEPELAACLFESARAGGPTAVEVVDETLMAGLSCGTVSPLAWDILARLADDFITIEDSLVPDTMKLLARSPFDDPPIVAGESAVAGLAGLLAVVSNPGLRNKFNLGPDSRVILIGTEGATDTEIYKDLTGLDPALVTRVFG
jgi:diaminopropionate ammonia-lyase